MSRPIITAAPDALNLEYRTGKAPAAVHTGQAELIIVLDGVGTITTGGTLVDAVSGANGNISGKDITGGTPQHLVKGDMLLVPQGTAHMMVPDAAAPFVLATLHVPRTGEPALVAGRAPASPKLINHAADIPAMTEKAKAAAATSPRFFGGDTILSLAPYRVGLEYRTAKGIASVHKNDGEFMLVLEGEGVIVAGGTVVNPKDLGANVDGDALAKAAAQDGVNVIPGSKFFAGQGGYPANLRPGRDHIRLSYSYATLDQIDEGVRRLGQAYRALAA